ncbi:MAG: RadC family protein [Schwartzia sp. (in: firmicutes)]
MTMLVRDLPQEARPREKLITHGAAALSDAELLAILLRTGTTARSVIDLAEAVLAQYRDKGLTAIVHMAPCDLAAIGGIGPAKAATILAAVELGRRIASRAAAKQTSIDGPEAVAAYAMPMFRFEMKEHFAVMLMDIRNHVISMPVISIGSLTASVVHAREIFREAIRQSAASVILIHNHPSGDPVPSLEDIVLTRRLVKVGKLMEIPVLDHIILGDGCFHSLKESGDAVF